MTDKAERALAKYVTVLETMMDRSLMFANNNYHRLTKRFYLSVQSLMLASGQFRVNRKRIYLHRWLNDNGLALIEVTERGQNLRRLGLKSATDSVVRLSKLVTVESTVDVKTFAKMTVNSLEALLSDKAIANQEYFDRIHPNFSSLSKQEVRDQYDLCEIDVNSLKQYIFWLVHKSDELNVVKRNRTLRQAEAILRIAQFTNGLLPQKKNHRFFGRNYYDGISVISVRKSLREAMLGDCYEYDMRSSAIAWKLGFAKMLLKREKSKEALSEAFGASQDYLNDKKLYIDDIREQTFGTVISSDNESKNDEIKEALTAISFGARMAKHGWIDAAGKDFSPALVKIIEDATERQRFIESDFMKLFWPEQKRLDKFIFEHFKRLDKSLALSAKLQTKSGRVSKSKVMAYLYQHAETLVMNIVRRELKRRKHVVIANVHDAIFVRSKIARKDKAEIERAMRKETNIKYWALKEKRLRAYAGISDQLRRETFALRNASPEQSLKLRRTRSQTR